MKSQTSFVARNVRLQEWAKLVRECNARPSEMTVAQWCAEHNITKCDYYYRLRAVRKACLESMPDSIVQQEIIPVSMKLLTSADESCVQESPVMLTDDSFIELSAHGIVLRVTEQTSCTLLSKVLGVLAHVK